MRRVLGYFILIWAIVAAGAYAQEEGARLFSSRFCTVFYENEADLRQVDMRLNLGFAKFYSPMGHVAGEAGGDSAEAVVSNKLDAIFNRAQEILDMYPKKIHVAVRIFKDREGLDKAYGEFFEGQNKAVSFYVYKTNTIYTIGPDMTENIIAHEMAHCIIDHYFVILPPAKIQEMLAAYVDMHLKD